MLQQPTPVLVVDRFPALLEGFQSMLMEVQVIRDSDYMYKE